MGDATFRGRCPYAIRKDAHRQCIDRFTWMVQMRSMNGQYILRIEDIDVQRSRQELAVEMMRDLEWLGLDWDEGPGVAGDYGPYHQAARQALYEREITKRWKPITCTPAIAVGPILRPRPAHRTALHRKASVIRELVET